MTTTTHTYWIESADGETYTADSLHDAIVLMLGDDLDVRHATADEPHTIERDAVRWGYTASHARLLHRALTVERADEWIEDAVGWLNDTLAEVSEEPPELTPGMIADRPRVAALLRALGEVIADQCDHALHLYEPDAEDARELPCDVLAWTDESGAAQWEPVDRGAWVASVGRVRR